MSTPDHVATEDCSIHTGMGKEPIIIPKGSFVRPIEYKWLPKHVKEDGRWMGINLEKFVFIYTKYGIVPVLITSIRKA